MSTNRLRRNLTYGTLATLAASYILIVVASGAGWDPFHASWDFTNSGAFGDSFGPLSTVMATVAAVSAIFAYRSQTKELRRVEQSAREEREARDRRDFESTFFHLLTLFRETVKEIDNRDRYGSNPLHGRDALKRVLEEQIGGTLGSNETDEANYRRVYFDSRDDLAHYFRLFYNIVRFIDKSAVLDKMLYVRLIRATLSDAEIILIALNCMYGGGKPKLTKLVERYAILHNISAENANVWRISNAFSSKAFGDRKVIKGKLAA